MFRAVLISIHPEHVESILSGRKVFEYRKVMPTQDVSHLVLYCTSPVKKVFAVAEVAERLVRNPAKLWTDTAYGSGITRKFYRDYFSGYKNAGAFGLGNVYRLSTPLELSKLTSCKSAPQSFCYLNASDTKLIFKKIESIPAIPSSLVFVGGIHGVGKTTICQKAFAPLGYRCFTASSLIVAHGRRCDKNKQVDNVPRNQAALIEQLAEEKRNHCRLLLDGHFTLLNSQGRIEPIDINVFEDMNPDKLILIKGDPNEIAMRLAHRDHQHWNTSLISEFQKAEEHHAALVSQHIGKKLMIISNVVTPRDLIRQTQSSA